MNTNEPRAAVDPRYGRPAGPTVAQYPTRPGSAPHGPSERPEHRLCRQRTTEEETAVRAAMARRAAADTLADLLTGDPWAVLGPRPVGPLPDPCPITGATPCTDRACELHYQDAPLRLTSEVTA